MEELSLAYDQMKNVLKKKKQFLEDQLKTTNQNNITDELLNELKDAFKHFDKDNSNQLDKLEFRAVLQAVGQNFTVSYLIVLLEVN